MSEIDTVRLYKFYPPDIAILNLKTRKLKLSTLEDLNDPFELLGATFSSREERIAWSVARDRLMHDKGIVCFSKTWRNPVIWSHYSKNHTGLALGFDINTKIVQKVKYVYRREKYPSIQALGNLEKLELMNQFIYTKFSHWKYENEWRIFAKKSNPDSEGRFFIDFDFDVQLKEVVIGAKSTVTSEALLNVGVNKDGPIKITTARLAFREFQIVTQKNRSLQR